MKRIVWIDYIKILSGFLVIWCHSILYFSPGDEAVKPVAMVIHSFNMPMLMAISGFFAARIINRGFWHSLARKFRQLILPLIGFAIISVALTMMMEWGEWGSGFYWGLFKLHLRDGLWFLRSAFICSAIYLLTATYKPTRWILVPLGIIYTQLTGWQPYMENANLETMYPMFLIGVLLNIRFEWFRQHVCTIGIISAIVYFLLIPQWDVYWFTESMPSDWRYTLVGGNEYLWMGLRRLFRVAIGCSGMLALMSIAEIFGKKITDTRVGKLMSDYGRYTLGLYIFQTIIVDNYLMRYVTLDNTDFILYNFIITPLLAFGIFVVSLFIISVLRRSRWISYLLLGQRMRAKSTE